MEWENLRDKLDDLKSRRLLLVYFLFATLLMIYQHSQGWAWDFSVYSLNGQYLFHEQVYMEWKRPPLLPTVLGLLQYLFSMRLSEYVFIVLNLVFFLFSSLKFSKVYDLNPLYLFVFVMSPYAIFYAALEGTELLFLSFLTLMLAEIQRPRAGLWFSLAFLTRYTGAVFLPLFLFQKNLKKWIYSGLIAFLVVSPWLLFNYIALGHPFASMTDSYALDVVERGLTTSFNPEDLFLMTGAAIPFALIYFKQKDFEAMDLMMLLTSVIIVSRQISTKIKVRRYLYDLSLSAAFFAAKGLNLFEDPEKIFYPLMVVYLIGAGYLIYTNPAPDPGIYREASEDIGKCKAVSNEWPMLSYAGTPTGPLEKQFRSKEDYISEGYKVVEFSGNNYTIKGDQCLRESFNSTYISRLDKHVYDGEVGFCDYMPVSTCKIEKKIGELVK
jgi:hypothetical protein